MVVILLCPMAILNQKPFGDVGVAVAYPLRLVRFLPPWHPCWGQDHFSRSPNRWEHDFQNSANHSSNNHSSNNHSSKNHSLHNIFYLFCCKPRWQSISIQATCSSELPAIVVNWFLSFHPELCLRQPGGYKSL